MTKSRFAQELEDRLLRYTAIDSQSDHASETIPSSEIQYDMLNLLVEELTEIGAQERQTWPTPDLCVPSSEGDPASP